MKLQTYFSKAFICLFALIACCNSSRPSNIVQPVKKITKVLVFKKDRKLQLLHHSVIVKSYAIALGFDPIGHKQHEGDGRTPEGIYKIDFRNPQSRYYKSLHITYPNAADREKAKKLKKNPGGDIFLHGVGKHVPKSVQRLHTMHDWTLGCLAVTNNEVDEIWKMVENGTPIEIRK